MNEIMITVTLSGTVVLERIYKIENNGEEGKPLFDISGEAGEKTLSEIVYEAQKSYDELNNN